MKWNYALKGRFVLHKSTATQDKKLGTGGRKLLLFQWPENEIILPEKENICDQNLQHM